MSENGKTHFGFQTVNENEKSKKSARYFIPLRATMI